MYLDPEGIARVSRWEGSAEIGGRPVWGRVVEALPIDDHAEFRAELAHWADTIERLPDLMQACGVADAIIEQRVIGIDELARALRDAAPIATVQSALVQPSGFEP